MTKGSVLLLFGLMVLAVKADLPVSCRYEEIRGNWTFYVGEGGNDETLNCDPMPKVVSTYKLELKYPNVVVDMFGNEGTWTMVEDEGFEVVIHGRKFFAFSKYVHYLGFCNQTMSGWSHDIMGRDWSCYYGEKDGSKNALPRHQYSENLFGMEEFDHMMYKVDESLIERINSDNNILWHAKKYERFEKMTVGQMKKRMGRKSSRRSFVKPIVASQEVKNEADKLPENFDWRNVDGVNYISPVRDQESCGSCYIFASVGMNEARLNIATNGLINVTLSPQDVLDCSNYSQGCGGGFEYLTAGKYAEDFGMVEESCSPYHSQSNDCNREHRNKCKKYYFSNYEYVGGYYGRCSEEVMRLTLVKNGPITVGIQILSDFVSYHGGIYHGTNVDTNFDPFLQTDHAVLIVGYGVEESTNTKYWSVKNSWDDDWGEQGYFRIRRGTNECNIESVAFQAFPIF